MSDLRFALRRFEHSPQFVAVAALLLLSGCHYAGSAMRQAGYAVHQRRSPEQRVYKHMLSRDTFYVFGTLPIEAEVNPEAIAVIALSDRFQPGEVVDVSHTSRLDSYYGLNLPEGDYHLVVVSDLNRDGAYDETEVVGGRELALRLADCPERVQSGIDLRVTGHGPKPAAPFRLAVQKSTAVSQSVFYPKGTIRSLDDPIFARTMAELGLYEPAAFLERAPMMFYALEEDLGYKVPVVFVHGIDGTPRDFTDLVAQLDRRYYRPWFFYYASGSDLDQLGEMFYRLFLSGKTIPLPKMPLVIVAHSMGGLVVRDALNRCTGKAAENTVALLITIASPLGGHPAAKNVTKAPLVIPSWRDLAPDSTFVQRLHRRPLPAGLSYQLLYTFGDPRALKTGESSDGVVPLSSQLAAAAQKEATAQFGVNATHTGVLRDPAAGAHVLRAIAEIKAPYPEDHLRVLLQGGFALPLGPHYSAREKYYVTAIGHYMDALVAGELAPIDPIQEHFIRACRGEAKPDNEVERAWLKFNREFPHRDRAGASAQAAGR